MSITTSVIIFAILLLASLVCINAVNNRQTHNRLISQRVEQLKRKIAEIEEISASVELLLGHSRVSYIMTLEEIEILERMIQLAPKDQLIQMALSTANEQLEALNSDHRMSKIYRIFESDAAMAKAQYQLNEAAKIIQRQTISGAIDEETKKTHIDSLVWAKMMISIVTYVAQGQKAIQNGNLKLKAQAFYKKALEIAHNTSINDERRSSLITELGELADGRRSHLSALFMPESI